MPHWFVFGLDSVGQAGSQKSNGRGRARRRFQAGRRSTCHAAGSATAPSGMSKLDIAALRSAADGVPAG